LAGRQYELAQFHFHTPSEHRLQGTELPAELHFVHKGPGNELAVVGVFIKEGAENLALSSFWSQLPGTKGQARQIQAGQLTVEQVLPQKRQHYLYPGSLTTPPCSEGVNWMVLNEPIAMSSQQLSALRSAIGTSNRPVQPLGDRELKLDR
jgi:carbonic anhydrase